MDMSLYAACDTWYKLGYSHGFNGIIIKLPVLSDHQYTEYNNGYQDGRYYASIQEG